MPAVDSMTLPQLRVILIGGSSNVGKSTLARYLADNLEWHCVSTDLLARHPGRPWSPTAEVPQHVAEHYLSLSLEELIEDVLHHYKRLQPKIHSLIMTHVTDKSTSPLILEGSALWPEFVSQLKVDNTAAIWLTASDSLFETRIHHESQIEKAKATEKKMIQNFLARTLRYNEEMMRSVNELGLASINVESASSLDDLSNKCLKLLRCQL
jgi:2-phosphoglycerate kinase